MYSQVCISTEGWLEAAASDHNCTQPDVDQQMTLCAPVTDARHMTQSELTVSDKAK